MTSPQDTGGAPPPSAAPDGLPDQESQTSTAPPPEPAAIGQPQPATQPPPATPVTHHRIRRTRVGGLWVGLALAAVVLLLLLVFILENGQRAKISYFGAHGQLPLGVALLFAAVAGALLVTIPASGRIIQLRRTARRHRRQDAAHRPTPPATGATGAPGNQP